MRASHSIRWLAAAIFVSAAMQSPLYAQTPLSDWLGAPGAAKFLTVQGNVSILKDTQAWAANIGGWVQPRQEIVTGHDGYAILQVSDGSRFEVFPNSRVLLDGQPLETTRATLAPGYVGFYLIEAQMPSLVNSGTAELRLEVAGRASNSVRVYIEP